MYKRNFATSLGLFFSGEVNYRLLDHLLTFEEGTMIGNDFQKFEYSFTKFTTLTISKCLNFLDAMSSIFFSNSVKFR